MSDSKSLPPTATAEVVPDKNPLTAEQYSEYERLSNRVQQQPTSVQAQQELASFKSLNGLE